MQDNRLHDETRQDMVWQDKTIQENWYNTRQDKAIHDKTKQEHTTTYNTRQDDTIQDNTRQNEQCNTP